MSDITRKDIDEFFTLWGQTDIVPDERDPVTGFQAWAWDVAEDILQKIDTSDEQLIDDIVYSVRQQDGYRGAYKGALADAAREFVEDYRPELVDAIAECLLRQAAGEDEPGDALRTIRKALGDTRAEFGARLGLNLTEDGNGTLRCYTYEDWESGKRTPDWEGRQKLEALADELEPDNG